ncbi:MAG: hypothetical protein ACQES2_00585 [Pseudomonadota bacterium]
MNTEKRNTETYILTDLEGLDAVTVYATNYDLGRGKLVIECFGEAWAHYWGAMGERTLQEFVLKAENDYLAMKLVREARQTDFEQINEDAQKRGFEEICVTNDVEIAMQSEEMADCFGEEWPMELPRCHTPEYRYLCKILNAVKAAFSEERVCLSSSVCGLCEMLLDREECGSLYEKCSAKTREKRRRRVLRGQVG